MQTVHFGIFDASGRCQPNAGSRSGVRFFQENGSASLKKLISIPLMY